MHLPTRLPLAHLPTPRQPLPRLSAALGLSLSVKRDDLTGSHLSGNKVRKLERLLADAVAQGATHVVTCGGVQSNHCRATALAAAPLGLRPVLLLRTAHGRASDLPNPSAGNVLLDRLVGARLVPCDAEGYGRRDALMAALADEIRADGGAPYVIPEGGSNALGATGYVAAVDELAAQLAPGEASPTSLFAATGSGGTLAGLAMGVKRLGWPTRVVGVAVCDDAQTFVAIAQRIAAEAAEVYGLPRLGDDDLTVIDHSIGRGYALTTPEELRDLAETARRDGLVLDPVYTNKGFRGMLRELRRPNHPWGQRPLFIHTGGIFGLLAAGGDLDAALTDGLPPQALDA